MGFAGRDDKGNLIHADVEIGLVASSVMAEALAIRLALHEALRLGFNFVQLEGDNLCVITPFLVVVSARGRSTL